MNHYDDKEKNDIKRRDEFIESLNIMSFAEFCGTIHKSQLADEVCKLIPEIRSKQISEDNFKAEYERRKEYIIDFIQRASKAILNDNMLDILPTEEKAVQHAKDFILP